MLRSVFNTVLSHNSCKGEDIFDFFFWSWKGKILSFKHFFFFFLTLSIALFSHQPSIMPPPNSFFLFSPSLLQKWGPLPKSQFSVPHMSHTFQQIRQFRKQQKPLNLCSWFYCNWCWFLTATTSSWKSTYQIGLSLTFAFVAAGCVFFTGLESHGFFPLLRSLLLTTASGHNKSTCSIWHRSREHFKLFCHCTLVAYWLLLRENDLLYNCCRIFQFCYIAISSISTMQ